MSQINTAPVDKFTTLRNRPMFGRRLNEIKAIEASISRYGLLSPIVVSRLNGRLVVVDGRKRLAAIKRLDFMGRLPRSLVNIPYIETSQISAKGTQTPALMSNRDLYVTVSNMFRDNQDIAHIAAELFLSRECIRQILTLSRLSPRLRRAFFDRTIGFESAKTYAAFPAEQDQNRAFMSLGPFASAQSILDYMSAPKAVPYLKLAA